MPRFDNLAAEFNRGMDRLRTTVQSLLIAVFAVSFVVGCGTGGPDEPPLAPVSGTVTLDGKPLPDALVKFVLTDGPGGQSQGTTDKDGKYVLKYKGTMDGAPVGTCFVFITNTDEANTPTEKLIPAKYKGGESMKKDVAPGANTIDLELSSK